MEMNESPAAALGTFKTVKVRDPLSMRSLSGLCLSLEPKNLLVEKRMIEMI